MQNDFLLHNIQLPNGEKTMGNKRPLIANSNMWKAIIKTTNLFTDPNKKRRVVDLGCFEGGYTLEFAKLGFETVGIDAKPKNIEKCNYVKSHFDLPNLNFVQDDVRNLEKYGKFDIIFCFGLLYHLDDPYAFMKTMSRCTDKLLLLNTHYAPEYDFRYDYPKLNKYIFRRTKLFDYLNYYTLYEISTNEGLKGRWYKEYNKDEQREKIDSFVLSSHNNHESFWICKKDLTKALHSVGFNSVFEQFDFTGDIAADDFNIRMSRSLFACVKH